MFLFSEYFRILSKLFSDFWPKNYKNLSKLPSTCPEEQFVAWFFFKFWNVSDFLQKHLAWFSKLYLRVQSKNCGKNSFFLFSFQSFFEIWAKIFQTFGQKTSRNRQNYLLRVQTNNFWLGENIKIFESFWIFCRNLRHGSQISIYVSRVKIAEETVFLFFFSELFRILSEKFFRLSAKKLQEVVKTTFCVSRGTLCDFIVFQKFWTVLDFVQKPLAWFSKIYLCVQSKNCGRNSFFLFFFSEFFRILSKIFSDFWPKNFKNLWKLTSAWPQEQLEALNFFKKFWTVLDFLQKPLAWFSKIYLSVQSENCGRNKFFCFSFQIFFELWAKYFQTFGQKTSRICEN